MWDMRYLALVLWSTHQAVIAQPVTLFPPAAPASTTSGAALATTPMFLQTTPPIALTSSTGVTSPLATTPMFSSATPPIAHTTPTGGVCLDERSVEPATFTKKSVLHSNGSSTLTRRPRNQTFYGSMLHNEAMPSDLTCCVHNTRGCLQVKEGTLSSREKLMEWFSGKRSDIGLLQTGEYWNLMPRVCKLQYIQMQKRITLPDTKQELWMLLQYDHVCDNSVVAIALDIVDNITKSDVAGVADSMLRCTIMATTTSTTTSTTTATTSTTTSMTTSTTGTASIFGPIQNITFLPRAAPLKAFVGLCGTIGSGFQRFQQKILVGDSTPAIQQIECLDHCCSSVVTSEVNVLSFGITGNRCLCFSNSSGVLDNYRVPEPAGTSFPHRIPPASTKCWLIYRCDPLQATGAHGWTEVSTSPPTGVPQSLPPSVVMGTTLMPILTTTLPPLPSLKIDICGNDAFMSYVRTIPSSASPRTCGDKFDWIVLQGRLRMSRVDAVKIWPYLPEVQSSGAVVDTMPSQERIADLYCSECFIWTWMQWLWRIWNHEFSGISLNLCIGTILLACITKNTLCSRYCLGHRRQPPCVTCDNGDKAPRFSEYWLWIFWPSFARQNDLFPAEHSLGHAETLFWFFKCSGQGNLRNPTETDKKFWRILTCYTIICDRCCSACCILRASDGSSQADDGQASDGSSQSLRGPWTKQPPEWFINLCQNKSKEVRQEQEVHQPMSKQEQEQEQEDWLALRYKVAKSSLLCPIYVTLYGTVIYFIVVFIGVKIYDQQCASHIEGMATQLSNALLRGLTVTVLLYVESDMTPVVDGEMHVEITRPPGGSPQATQIMGVRKEKIRLHVFEEKIGETPKDVASLAKKENMDYKGILMGTGLDFQRLPTQDGQSSFGYEPLRTGEGVDSRDRQTQGPNAGQCLVL